MKYRLNIKYPIIEEDVEKLAVNEKSISWAFRNNTLFESYKLEDFSGFPKSWIEEIKEPDIVEKWYFDYTLGHGNIEDGGEKSEELIRDCWKASEKNTHLMYKELMDYLYFRYPSLSPPLAKIITDLKNKLKE